MKHTGISQQSGAKVMNALASLRAEVLGDLALIHTDLDQGFQQMHCGLDKLSLALDELAQSATIGQQRQLASISQIEQFLQSNSHEGFTP